MSKHDVDPRELAVEAAARGLIDADELWQLASSVRDATRMRARLEALVGPEQVEVIAKSVRRRPRTPVTQPTGSDLESGARPLPGPPRGPNPSAQSLSETQLSYRPSRDPGGVPGKILGPRYRETEVLGKGGVGEVVAARDREIGRTVALKTLQSHMASDTKLVRKFLLEARVTAQLEHPNIVPVYDIGVEADGSPFYTMRVVKKQSLADVLDQHSWPMVRLLGALSQVSRALAYAHSLGVMHGDIKPENILLGDFGEVYLADWGLTRVEPQSKVRTARSTAPPPGEDESEPSALDIHSTHQYDVQTSPPGGTPGYLAPEVAVGDSKRIDHRADLFSLGVVLYEILTGEQPFQGETARLRVVQTVTVRPKRPREVVPGCPLLLEDLCLGLLEKDPNKRIESAAEVADKIEAYLEGAKEKERRKEEARRLSQQAQQPVAQYYRLEEERKKLSRKAHELLKDVEGWRSLEDKRPAWKLDERAGEAERESARALASAIELYTKALGYDVECKEAHEGLAELYWARAQEAHEQRREPTQIYYEALVREHDAGRYATLMDAKASLTMRSDPPGAAVTLLAYREKERILVAAEARMLGATPVTGFELEPGSYLVLLDLPGYRQVGYPVMLGRGGRHEAVVSLYTEDEIGPDFVLVPGSAVYLGGDAEAVDPIPRQEVYVPDFAIAKFPITLRDYCTYLNDLETRDAAEASRRAPCDLPEISAAAVMRTSDGWVPHDLIVEGPAREQFPPATFWDIPLLLGNWFEAVAYCRWRSERDGVTVRLPTEAEWEKAARGADARFFPWGDHFDPTFCKMRSSRRYTHQPEPNGTFPQDVSPYGVRDMAGGFREWVGDKFGERSAAEMESEPEPAEGTTRGESGWRVIRGGGWSVTEEWCRAASRSNMYASARGLTLGFRVAKTLVRKG